MDQRARMRSICQAVLSGLTAALAGAVLWAIVGQVLRPAFQTADILFDLPVPTAASCLAQMLLAAALLAGLRRSRSPRLRLAVLAVLLPFIAFALLDTLRYYTLWARGQIVPQRALPLSAYLAILLAAQALRWRIALPVAPADRPQRRGLRITLAALSGAFLLPVVDQAFFGSTRYVHQADVAVVLGAGVYADGTPSQALRDRVKTAAGLYRDGQVHALLMTGGIDPRHGQSEPEAMRRLAVALGVPASAVVLDDAGDNTRASIDRLGDLMRRHGWKTSLAVSHDFHLPRIKRLADRHNLRLWTVPAQERWPLSRIFRIREVAAWHWYLVAG